mgnify:CR=1 FL=1
METRANHVLIGSFALLVVAAAMLFALWIGKSSLDREFAEYDVIWRLRSMPPRSMSAISCSAV